MSSSGRASSSTLLALGRVVDNSESIRSTAVPLREAGEGRPSAACAGRPCVIMHGRRRAPRGDFRHRNAPIPPASNRAAPPRRRLGAGFGIGQMIGMVAARRHAHVEQLDQPALGQFARDQLPLHQADRAAVHDCLRHMAGFREGDAAAVVEIRHAGGGHPQRPVGPDHAAGPAIHVAQRMRGQVARLARRRAGFEQARAANRHHHRAEQPVRHDAGIAARAISDGRVQVMGVEVAQRIADIEAQLPLRMRGAKARQTRQQPVRGKARAH